MITKILFGGDMLPTDEVLRTLGVFNHPQLLFKNLTNVFQEADLLIANLECPLTGVREPFCHQKWNFKANELIAEHLSNWGFNAVTLANNHVMNYGIDGLKSTIQRLDEFQIGHVGAGMEEQEATDPFFVDLSRNRTLAIIAIKKHLGFFDDMFYLICGQNRPGVATERNLELAVRKAKQHAELVMLSLHWDFHPSSKELLDFVESCFQYGIDIIVTHGSHHVEPAVGWHNHLAFLGLGNFVFDWPENGVLAMLYPKSHRAQYQIYPICLNQGPPKLARDVQRQTILEAFNNNLYNKLLDPKTQKLRQLYAEDCVNDFFLLRE